MSAVARAASAVGGPLIVCERLSRRYGRTTALDSVDLTLRAGPPIALVGPNGAGKTTLLAVLAGFVRADGGRVRVLGERPGSGALAGRLAALPQDALFDPRLDIGRQLRLLAELQGATRRVARVEVARVLERVGLADVTRHRPDALSHGMRKRVALAQTLLGSPEIVLLDEPTAGIDPENARLIRELLAEEAARRTFVISSHNLDELQRLCGSVVQLEAGGLIRHEPLTATGGVEGDRRGAANEEAVDELTIGLIDVPDVSVSAFHEAVLAVSGVRSARALRRGEWRVVIDDDARIAAALIALFAERGWRWRHITRGRSLEERLYGD